ncbi:MAG: hypothetical protein IJV06_01670 [Bacteroidaceae bacterium]|nr:hypothetical protein [Bacteroidaceae bacterium]
MKKKPTFPSPEYVDELTELVETLVSKGYFSAERYAQAYVKKLNKYARTHAAIAPRKPVPDVFDRYGHRLTYFTYTPSTHTTWYIFLEETDTVYVLRHITNNHIAGQYFNT